MKRTPVPAVSDITRPKGKTVDKTIRAIADLPSEGQVNKFLSATHAGYDETGSTMDLKSHTVYTPGKSRGYVVGGVSSTEAKDSEGRPEQVRTHLYDTGASEPHLSPTQFMSEFVRIRKHTGTIPGAAIGSFVEKARPELGVQIDASQVYKNENDAKAATVAREENSYFQLKEFDSVDNAAIRKAEPEKYPGVQKKKPKQEMSVPTDTAPNKPEFWDK